MFPLLKAKARIAPGFEKIIDFRETLRVSERVPGQAWRRVPEQALPGQQPERRAWPVRQPEQPAWRELPALPVRAPLPVLRAAPVRQPAPGLASRR